MARQILAKPMLVQVTTHHVRAADIGFPFVEHRAEIKEHSVVHGDRMHRSVLREMRTVFGPERTIRLCQCWRTPNDCSAST
jgi:hypothetical protein